MSILARIRLTACALLLLLTPALTECKEIPFKDGWYVQGPSIPNEDYSNCIQVGGDIVLQSSNFVLTSTDRGSTWRYFFFGSDTVMFGDPFNDLGGMVATRDGVLFCTEISGARRDQSSTITSLDHGRNWSSVGDSGEFWGPTRSICFPYAMIGWAGRIRRTRDGGHSWDQLTVPHDSGNSIITTYALLDSLHGWVVVGWPDSSRPPDGEFYEVEATSDCGSTWESRWRWTGTRVPPGGEATGSFAEIAFQDTLRGIAWMRDSAYYRTDDGGRTWSEIWISRGNHGIPIFNAISVFSPNDVWLNVVPERFPNGDSLVMTRDGGTTWVVTPNVGSYGSICRLDSGFAIQNDLLESFDDGLSWAPPPGYFQWGAFEQVLFVDSLRGIVLADPDSINQARRTTDGGENWLPMAPSIVRAARVGRDRILGINNRNVFLTTDVGATWDTLTPVGVPRIAPSSKWADVLFRDSLNGWLLQRHSGICATHDGGNSWEQVLPDTNSAAGWGYGIMLLVDSLHAWYGGTERTTDGGRTWEIGQFTPSAYGETPVAASRTHMFALNDTNGGFSESFNGGLTWKRGGYFPYNPGYSTLRMAFSDSLNGWGGAGPNSYRTSDGGRSWVLVSTAVDIVGHQFGGTGPAGQFFPLDPAHAWMVDRVKILRYRDPNPVGVEESPPSTPISLSLVDAYPDPSDGHITLALQGMGSRDLRIEAIDMVGRAHDLGVNPAGARSASIDGSALPSGLYLLRIRDPLRFGIDRVSRFVRIVH